MPFRMIFSIFYKVTENNSKSAVFRRLSYRDKTATVVRPTDSFFDGARSVQGMLRDLSLLFSVHSGVCGPIQCE